MKPYYRNFLYLLFLLYTITTINGQTWNVGRYTDTEQAIYLLESPAGIDMVTKSQRYQNVYRYNHSGQLVFAIAQKLWNKRPIVNYAGEIITITNRDGCDYQMSAPYVKTIKKITPLGQSATTYTFLSSQYDEYMPLLLLPDSGYVAIADTLLVRFNKSHQYVSRKNLGMGGTTWAQVINNRIVVSGTTTAGPKLLFLNLNLQLTSSITTPTNFTKGVQLTPTLTILQGINNQLYKLYDTTSLSPPFNIGNKLVEDFALTHDSIVAILHNSGKTNQLAIGDLNGNLLWSYTANEASTNYKNIAYRNGTIIHTNSQLATSYPVGFVYNVNPSQVGLNKATWQTPEPSNADIRLVSLVHDSVYMTLNGYSGTVYTRVKYTVQNNSPFTITNFQLASYARDNLPCGHQFVLQKVITNIPPNATQTFTSNWFYLDFPGSPFYPIKSPISFQKCYYLTLPNGFTDTKLSDNESCLNDVATRLNKQYLDIGIKVLPNPVNDHLYIESILKNYSIEIRDISGTLLHSFEIEAGVDSIDCSNLPNGLYFVIVHHDKGMYYQKLIVQH